MIGYCVAYRGTLSRAAVEPRGLLVPPLLANAAGVVLFHNHPSGDPTPSAEDRALTQRTREAGELLGLRVHDHLILAPPARWRSLREMGAMS